MSRKKFKVGDRVKFIEDYSTHGAPLGSRGVVTAGGSYNCYQVQLDNGTFPKPAAEHRLELLTTAAPSNDTLFKRGDTGLTRSGASYEVVDVIARLPKPVIALVGGRLSEFRADGRNYSFSVSHTDLLPPKNSTTTYINVYRDGYSIGYPTLDAARAAANPGVLLVGHEVTIDLP